MKSFSQYVSSTRTELTHFWQSLLSWLNESPNDQPTIFRSARLKLTSFYLATILVLCLSLTLSVRALAERQYSNADVGEQGIVHHLLFDQFSVPPTSPDTFNRYQINQDSAVDRRLTEDVILINLVVLVLGGWLSYWFAGRTLEPIEEAHETQARFASDASHELRTPLASMRVENEVFLRQKSFSQTEARALIESNLEEVQRLESLSSNLLALTQYEHAAIKLSAVAVQEAVEGAVSQVSKQAKAKGIQLVNEVKSADLLANLESVVLMLTIVLDNAIKYSPRKSTIYIRGGKQGSSYILYVQDEGPGIPTNDLPYIFDRLFRGDKARSSRVSGYGLGLSLAKEIARVNHGAIEASNYPSGGALLTMTFNLMSSPRRRST